MYYITNSSSKQTWQKPNIYVLQFSARKTAAIIHMYKEINKGPCGLSSSSSSIRKKSTLNEAGNVFAIRTRWNENGFVSWMIVKLL